MILCPFWWHRMLHHFCLQVIITKSLKSGEEIDFLQQFRLSILIFISIAFVYLLNNYNILFWWKTHSPSKQINAMTATIILYEIRKNNILMKNMHEKMIFIWHNLKQRTLLQNHNEIVKWAIWPSASTKNKQKIKNENAKLNYHLNHKRN